ncbi:hypothetical protein [Kitasatospora sp. NBC_01539]|uniref:hypothetical protein n=1 Tax=Kitasatospora sp. NBC_01539 TaxID=2903577 RepID=UPI0038600F8A
MSRTPAALRALRITALPLLVTGLGAHLRFGTKLGLAGAALGLAAHLGATAIGAHRMRRHRPAPPEPRV